MPTVDAVIDSCCTLNLLATRREVEIVRALKLRLLDTPQTAAEPMFLYSPPDEEGERSRESVSTESLRKGGRLTTRKLDTDALLDAFVAAAALIKDTDASCIAVAGTLGLPLITDDRKERRIAVELFPAITLISTLDLLHDAAHALGWSHVELARVATALRWGGNFAPPRQDPRAAWYEALLRSA
jgi:predicted nucleic acid-binding protein